MNTVHLIGAEEVRRAGCDMQAAAESIARSAMQIQQSNDQLIAALAEHAARVEHATSNDSWQGGPR